MWTGLLFLVFVMSLHHVSAVQAKQNVIWCYTDGFRVFSASLLCFNFWEWIMEAVHRCDGRYSQQMKPKVLLLFSCTLLSIPSCWTGSYFCFAHDFLWCRSAKLNKADFIFWRNCAESQLHVQILALFMYFICKLLWTIFDRNVNSWFIVAALA